MDLAQWLVGFRALHDRARQGPLSGMDAQAYQAGRDELARALVKVQGVAVPAGQSPRQALRVPKALQVDVESAVRKDRITTFDLSLAGFSALMSSAPAPDEAVTATLRLPGTEPVATPVTVADLKRQPGNVRVTFRFRTLGEKDRERLELAIFDAVLGQLAR
jgi:hypothetical protein